MTIGGKWILFMGDSTMEELEQSLVAFLMLVTLTVLAVCLVRWDCRWA